MNKNLSKTHLAISTQKLRGDFVLQTAKLLTPTLYKEILTNYRFVGQTPRPFTLKLKRMFGNKPLIGVEIGFCHGENAKSILQELNIKKLYSIEPYLGMIHKDYVGVFKGILPETAKQILKSKKIIMIQKTSNTAINHLPKKVDFVYIDGSHEYKHVIQDLINYYPLVKKGLVGGHDLHHECLGVINAVINFSVELGKSPIIKYPDFWYEKVN